MPGAPSSVLAPSKVRPGGRCHFLPVPNAVNPTFHPQKANQFRPSRRLDPVASCVEGGTR